MGEGKSLLLSVPVSLSTGHSVSFSSGSRVGGSREERRPCGLLSGCPDPFVVPWGRGPSTGRTTYSYTFLSPDQPSPSTLVLPFQGHGRNNVRYKTSTSVGNGVLASVRFKYPKGNVCGEEGEVRVS